MIENEVKSSEINNLKWLGYELNEDIKSKILKTFGITYEELSEMDSKSQIELIESVLGYRLPIPKGNIEIWEEGYVRMSGSISKTFSEEFQEYLEPNPFIRLAKRLTGKF